ncbi:hypothetical protein [Nocardia sp. NBC_00403]|uniref:hypothetical protein n=1 Tax=Nocardia sp. NBC_00403 TaxID=2975990 RepID=UPI002E1E0750
MVEATESITRLLKDGAHTINNRVGVNGFAGELDNAGRTLTNGDGASVSVLNRYSFSLQDDQGVAHHIHDIRVIPLVDHEGNTFGISFPTKKGATENDLSGDKKYYETWSRMPDRLSDSEYYPVRRVDPGDGSDPDWKDAGPSQPAPWADDAREGMLYVHAHGRPEGIEIDANFGDDANPDWQTVGIPGGFFGQLVAANLDFQSASRAGPNKPLMMLVCEGDAHVQQVAGAIHSAGMNHDVWATVGVNQARFTERKGTAELGAEIPDGGAPSDPITVIRAPNRPPTT